VNDKIGSLDTQLAYAEQTATKKQVDAQARLANCKLEKQIRLPGIHVASCGIGILEKF